MKYEPNLSDTRVLKRIKHAYAYTLANFSEDESPHSMKAIAKRFGQAQHPLSQWLQKKLLICTDHHYSNAASLSKKYVINLEGAIEVDEILNSNLAKVCTTAEIESLKVSTLKHTLVSGMYAEEFKDELATGEFQYKDQSQRLWHPIQHIKKTYKRDLLNKTGYRHEYDIECCAPTLLYQEALKHGLTPQPMLEHYMECKAEVRDVLSVDLGITVDTVKMIVNALFAGAKLGRNPQFSLYRELDQNDALILKIQSNEYITALREQIRAMWAVLPVSDKRKSRLKWDLYFGLERRVLDSVQKFLRKTKNKHLAEHDGWTCVYEIDQIDLKRFVKETTGFDISLKHIRLENNMCSDDASDMFALLNDDASDEVLDVLVS